jgi:uncharacterized integral membrane protein
MKGSAETMTNYFLGIFVELIISAAYANGNTEQITVNFLIFQQSFPQGIWEMLLFSLGAILMWIFSVGASIESYTANRKKIKEMNKKITDLEDEKKSLLVTLQNLGGKPRPAIGKFFEVAPAPVAPAAIEIARESPESTEQPETASEESSLSFMKSLFASIFKSDKNKKEGSPTEQKPETETFDEAPETVCEIEIDIPEGEIAENEEPDTNNKETFSV